MDLRFTWDADTARANARKHGVAFAEAATVLGDALSLTIADPIHLVGEERWVDIGMSDSGRLLVVVYIERESEIRIISARFAAGTNVVRLDDDVAEVFHTPESVNGALRTIAQLVRERTAKDAV